jgi:steroid delta-isomerase-like uncharacterized protein
LVAACGGGGEAAKPVEQPKPAPSASTPPPPVASASASASAAPALPPPSADATMTVRTVLDGFNRQDPIKYVGAYAADASIVIAGMPDVKGSAAIEAEHRRLLEAFPDTRMNGVRLYTKGDIAVMEWVLSATHQNDWMGVKAANKPVGVRGMSIFWIDADGGIKKEARYYDVATLIGQAGGLKGTWRSAPLLPAQMKAAQSTGDASEGKNVDVVKKLYTALGAKNEGDFLGTQSDSVELDDQTRAQSYLGTVDTKKMFDMWTKALPDIKVEVANAWGFGEWVVVETVFAGKQTGAMDGMPASGKAVTLHGAGVFQMKDGKIFKGWTYANGLELRTQAGTYKMPPPAAAPPAGKK